MADNNANGYFTESPMMAWDPFLDPNIPPLDLDGNATAPFGPYSFDNGVENWLQDANAGGEQPELTTHHGHTRALSTSAIPPQINIDYAPPSKPQAPDQVNGAASMWSGDWHQSPTLLPFDMRQRPRSPSPAQSTRSSSRMRSASTGSIQRDYILDLADPQRPVTPQSTARVQKHPATFQCTLCPKRFTRAYNLRSHLRTHTDERPFVCTVCGKAFGRQQDRKRHEGLHSGEKKFVCRGDMANGNLWGCGRRFARADALFRHVRSEAGQVCIRPLAEEETHGDLKSPPNPHTWLPAALLAQYPALAAVRSENLSAYDTSISPPSRTSSCGASSYGSNWGNDTYSGFGFDHSISRQVSDTSLHSAYSATSFSSQRGSRVVGGYECSQCGAAFDVPSELRHHERKHMTKEQRPHACEHCGERFLYPKDVQRHVGRKHADVTSLIMFDLLSHSSPLLNPIPQAEACEFQPDLFMMDHSPGPTFLALDTNAVSSSANAVSDNSIAQDGPSQVENPHGECVGNGTEKSDLPRSKSTEILDLKQALEAAKRDAKLWREERNFYAELLQESIPHTDLDLALRFVHKDEIVSPVRRARGWLGGIWGLFRARRKTEYEDEGHRTASRAVVALAAQLEGMDVGGDCDAGGRRKSGSREGSRSSSPIRAKWKEFEGWVAGGK